jgi:hypothetical protein
MVNVSVSECALWDNLFVYLASDFHDEKVCAAHVESLDCSGDVERPQAKTVVRLPVELDWVC